MAEYIDLFGNFSDDAAPAPEVEIKVKIPSKQFYQKYLDNSKFSISNGIKTLMLYMYIVNQSICYHY